MDSPFRSLLNTNFVPSDDESAAIRSLLRLSLKELTDLEVKSEIQEAGLESHRERYRLLVSDIDAHRALLSPTRRMPDDILALVFAQCLPPESIATMCPNDAPVVLCHVCSRWRWLALATPELWSSLHIVTQYNVEVHMTSEAQLRERDSGILKWLARSGALPLSLSFAPRTKRRPTPAPGPVSVKHTFNTTDLTRIFQLLVPTYDRWDSVDIICMGWSEEILPSLQRSPDWMARNPLARVRRLALRWTWDSAVSNTTNDKKRMAMLIEMLGLASNPNLREVTLSKSGLILPLIRQLPCSQLHVVSFHDPLRSTWAPRFELSYGVVLYLLRKSPNLRAFSFNYYTWDLTPQCLMMAGESQGDLVNPYLEYLFLSFNSPDDFYEPGFVNMIHWPRLAVLTLRHRCPHGLEDGPVPPTLHLPLLQKLGATLTYLAISSALEVWRILEHLPILVQLHLEARTYPGGLEEEKEVDTDKEYMTSWRNSSTSTILSLTPNVGLGNERGPPHVCTNLQSLKWEGYTFFKDEELLQLLVNRSASLSPSSAPLKQVHIVFSRAREFDIVPECEALIATGLDLRLTYVGDPGDIEARLAGRGSVDFRDRVPIGWEPNSYI